MVKSPCLNCLERCVGCHSGCMKYRKFVADKEFENKSIRKQKYENSATWGTAVWSEGQRRDWRRKAK